MRLKFAVTKSAKIASPLRVRRVTEKVEVGDKLPSGQEVVQTFWHEPLPVSRYRLGKPRSARGNKELEFLVATMDFAQSVVPNSGTEMERLLTSAFRAGMESNK